MKIAPVEANTIQAATEGDLHALHALLAAIEPGIYNLAVRMLGNREDAQDASQEILLKVTTHLGSFRGEAAFSTWVYQVAKFHLRSAITRSKESPEVSLDALQGTLQKGLDRVQDTWQERALQPDEKAAAREMAISCTQGMLMRLDREHRLAYLLDTVFDLSSSEAAQVLEISAEAYRKRVSRAKQALETVGQTVCGVVNPQAACRCEKQTQALAQLQVRSVPVRRTALMLHAHERAQAERTFEGIERMSDMAAVMRAHPQWQAPQEMRETIRAVLTLHHPEGGAGVWQRKIH
jgi:RNA polymerase sigma factor (sigma-70 family)